MNRKCTKCGASDLSITFTPKDSQVSKKDCEKIDNKFIIESEWKYGFDYFVRKEFLRVHCKTCHYEWFENTIQGES